MARKRNPRRNLFRGFVDVMSEMNRAQEQWMLHQGAPASGHGERSEATAYVPPADIFALGEDLIVRCEVPGIRRDDVSVSLARGVLTIHGQRDSELDDSHVVYYTRERVYGAFRRTMLLPEGVAQDDIAANVRNGLLEITIRGAANPQLRNIRIEDVDD